MIYQIDCDFTVNHVTSNYVEHTLAEYVPKQSLLVSDSVIDRFFKDYQSIDYSKYSCVVFNFCINPVDPENYVQRVKSLNLPLQVYFLQTLYDRQNSTELEVKFFPFWAVWSSLNPNPFRNGPKQYNVSCLNGTPWEHRKYTYLQLATRPYFDQMVFTFKNSKDYVPLENDIVLTAQERADFDRLPQQVAFLDQDLTIGIDMSNRHPAYTQTYINLVTETNTSLHTPMLSEKTFKPIASGQLFVLIASPGAVKFLQNIGIDTFDDIVNHSYDGIFDTKIRIDQALRSLDQLITLDLNDLYVKLLPRLQRNAEFLASPEFRKQFLVNFG